ncbi:Helo-like-N domain-containing protein [Mycena sanguinolenta]|uniref:Helo-like-N domain-containing protein n=1 Tax=Mycena sanguinolenta TaxID=230812 RepID=A0A8H6XYZ3_9AGAR|nr:Helo-like-N domain-containing protein [Mycena sanguinolenta]
MSFSGVSFGDLVAAAGLAMKIVQVLYDSPRVLEDYQDAMTELVSLHRELVLINDAIQLATPSGTSDLIRQSVAGEARGCLAEMQRFLDKTKGVAETGMVGIFSRVLWATSEKKELRVLRESVARRRASLNILLSSSNLRVIPVFIENRANN